MPLQVVKTTRFLAGRRSIRPGDGRREECQTGYTFTNVVVPDNNATAIDGARHCF